MGDWEARPLGLVESLVKYHPVWFRRLTRTRYPGGGQREAGSLTGAVASQMITEAHKGSLSTVGNRA